MGLSDTVELAYKYGTTTVLTFLIFGVMIWLLKRTLDGGDKREERLANIINSSQATFAVNLAEVSKAVAGVATLVMNMESNLKERQQSFIESHRKQREEHTEMLEKLGDVIEEVEGVKKQVKALECKAA